MYEEISNSALHEVDPNLYFLCLVLSIHEVGGIRRVQVQLELHVQPQVPIRVR